MILHCYLYSSSIPWLYGKIQLVHVPFFSEVKLFKYINRHSTGNNKKSPENANLVQLKRRDQSSTFRWDSLLFSQSAAWKEVGIIRCGGLHWLCAGTVLHWHAELQFVIPKSVTPPMSKFGLQISPLKKMYLPCELFNTGSPALWKLSDLWGKSKRGSISYNTKSYSQRKIKVNKFSVSHWWYSLGWGQRLKPK